MRHYEVAVRSSAPVTAPRDLCSACGRRPEHGGFFRRGYTPFERAGSAALEACELPLCDACADAHAGHQRFVMVGAAVGLALGVAAYAAYWRSGGVEPAGAGIITVVLRVMVAGGIGALAATLIAAAFRGVWKGSRVANSASVKFEGWRPGLKLEEHRAFFRFTSEEYARAFAAANVPNVLPGRGRHAIPLPAATTPRKR